jgi:hypothetical protein
MANEQNLKPFKKGDDPRRNLEGAPRKWISQLKDNGYKVSEVNDCILVMLSLTIEELGEVYKNPKATILEKSVANSLKKSIEKGSLYSLDVLLNRAVGKPKESVDHTTKGEAINEIKVTIVNGYTSDTHLSKEL